MLWRLMDCEERQSFVLLKYSYRELLDKSSSSTRRMPANPNHKIYQRNDRLIQREVFKTVARRDVCVRVSQICRQARISLPTFYLHYSSCNEVLDRYELNLMKEFKASLSSRRDAVTTYTILLIFLYQHRKYFKANLLGANYYMLAHLLQELRPILATTPVEDRSYLNYMATIMSGITWWGIHEGFSKYLIPKCAARLAAVKFVR